MGGGTTEVYQPEPAAQPSTAEAVQAWADTMPQVYETQMEYAPQQAQQQLELAQQYAQPYGEAYKQAQEAMYPEVTALQQQLYGQVEEGMGAQVPDWMANQYRSNLSANIGSNIGSGIGADYLSTNMLQQQQDYQNYYRNIALSMAGQQPIQQAATPRTSDYMSQFTPGQTMGFMGNTYGTYSQAATPQVGFSPDPTGAIVGGLAGMAGSLGSAAILAPALAA